MPRNVLVTGASRYLGAIFAKRISAHPDVDRVIAVDIVPPPRDLGGAEFVRADIRNPVIGRVIERASIDTVIHLNVIATPAHVGGRAAMKEINVIGTMQLLAACQKSETVQKLVVKSTAGVYGASPRDPAHFTEDMVAKTLPRTGWAKDCVEVEGYIRSLCRRRPDMAVTVLRFANFMGPGIQTVLTDYFSLPVVPTILGFDPRLQFIHEHDGLDALEHAMLSDITGTYNIAGDGVVTLQQILALAHRVPAPVPPAMVKVVAHGVRRSGLVDFTADQLNLLRFGRVIDTTAMAEILDYHPKHSSREAFADFAKHRIEPKVTAQQVVTQAEEIVLTAAEKLRQRTARTGS